MTVEEIKRVSKPSGRALIVKDKEVLYIGWFCNVPEELKHKEVRELSIEQEVKHKDWKRLGLRSPLQPEEMPDYCFADLMTKLYYKMKI